MVKKTNDYIIRVVDLRQVSDTEYEFTRYDGAPIKCTLRELLSLVEAHQVGRASDPKIHPQFIRSIEAHPKKYSDIFVLGMIYGYDATRLADE